VRDVRHARGFTLIEVLVALMVVAMGLAALMVAVSGTARSSAVTPLTVPRITTEMPSKTNMPWDLTASIALAMASPTGLIRRNIRNTPIGAPPSASAIMPASARRMNSNSVKGPISTS